jgi:hypothetical protein
MPPPVGDVVVGRAAVFVPGGDLYEGGAAHRVLWHGDPVGRLQEGGQVVIHVPHVHGHAAVRPEARVASV